MSAWVASLRGYGPLCEGARDAPGRGEDRWWIKLFLLGRPRWAKLVPRETVLSDGDGVKLMVPRLPGDLPSETLVTVAKRRPEGASGMLVRAVSGLVFT